MPDTKSYKVVPSFTLPANARPSERYRQRFNDVAKELKIDAQWVKDETNPLVIDAEEIQSASSYSEEDIRKVLAEVEQRRLKSVEASALYHKRIPFRAPLELLNPVERRAVELFAEKIKPALDRIDAQSHDSHALELADTMQLSGDYYSKILFARLHRDTCAGIEFMKDPACSLFPFYPDQPPLNGMIDPAIAKSSEEFSALVKQWKPEDERLRATTLLSKNGNGEIIATPIVSHPAYKKDHQDLAWVLVEIAGLNVGGDRLDPQVQKQLLAWARFFQTGTAEDEAAAVQATIDAGEGGGNLLINLGPAESYWDDNVKLSYLLQVGVKDPSMQARFGQQSALFQTLENSLTGMENYTPRQLSTRGGFANPMYQAVTGGFWETFSVREPIANSYPNHDYPTVEGTNRFISMEGTEAAAGQLKIALSRLLDEDVSGWDAQKLFTELIVDHESGHLLGPQTQHEIPNLGKVGVVFGPSYMATEEAKADLTAAATTRLLYQRGELKWDQVRERVQTNLAMSMSNRYKGKAAFASGLQAHYYGHMLEVGHWFQTGALTLVEVEQNGMKEKRIHVDYEKILESSWNLWRTLIQFQASGDVNGFKALGTEAVSHIPDEADAMILKANADLPMFFIERHL